MILKEIEIQIRVRYSDTDRMGVVHHSNYFRYFEIARIEQFRNWGLPYAEFEDCETRLMITDMHCQCRSPAHFDQILFVKAEVDKMTRFRILHNYGAKLECGKIIAVGKTAMAAVSKEGFPVPLPDSLWELRHIIIGQQGTPA